MNTNVMLFFFFQAEDGIRDLTVTGSDVCSSDLVAGEEREKFSKILLDRLVVEIDAHPEPSDQLQAVKRSISGFRKGKPVLAAIDKIGRATSELQSQSNLVCRLLLEKKKKENINTQHNTADTI